MSPTHISKYCTHITKYCTHITKYRTHTSKQNRESTEGCSKWIDQKKNTSSGKGLVSTSRTYASHINITKYHTHVSKYCTHISKYRILQHFTRHIHRKFRDAMRIVRLMAKRYSNDGSWITRRWFVHLDVLMLIIIYFDTCNLYTRTSTSMW